MKTNALTNLKLFLLVIILYPKTFLTQEAGTDSSTKKDKILILDFETNISDLGQGGILSELVRIEVEKFGKYDIIERNDAMYLAKKYNLSMDNCSGNLCLLEIAKLLGTNKVAAGSVKKFQNKIVCSFRILNVARGSAEKNIVEEYLPITEESGRMVQLTLQKLLGLSVDETAYKSLTRKDVLENELQNPNISRLKLDGPRMGVVVITGEHGRILSQPYYTGGFNTYPVMYQFGYQFEKQYFTSGKWQALFEFIPQITGLDQNNFFPSLVIMNGIRNNLSGWEFGIGPTFNISRFAKGYYDSSGTWNLEKTWQELHPDGLITNPYPIQERLDSRGYTKITTGVVVAFGKTFKSGKLNIPFNAFVVPSTHGIRFGISFGYNSKG